jgi:hypothetical protein
VGIVLTSSDLYGDTDPQPEGCATFDAFGFKVPS